MKSITDYKVEVGELADSGRKDSVVVDGATGYVGNHLVKALISSGYEVRCIVRSEARSSDRQFLESIGARVFATDLKRQSQVLKDALCGAICAVHLIGSIAPKKGEKLEDLHGGQTAELVAACREMSVPKVVLLTALGSSADAVSDYHRTKAQSEKLVRESGLKYVVLQPSLIVGRQVGTRDSKLVARYRKMIQEKSGVPLINGGTNKLQPVFIADLTAALVKSATTDVADGKTVEIGGADVVDMRQFVNELMRSINIEKPIRAIPAGLVSLAAVALEIFQPVPLVSRDQVRLACQDNACKNNGLQTVFGVEPAGIKTALQSYRTEFGAATASRSQTTVK